MKKELTNTKTFIMYGINPQGKLVLSSGVANGNTVEKEVVGLRDDLFQGEVFILNRIIKK